MQERVRPRVDVEFVNGRGLGAVVAEKPTRCAGVRAAQGPLSRRAEDRACCSHEGLRPALVERDAVAAVKAVRHDAHGARRRVEAVDLVWHGGHRAEMVEPPVAAQTVNTKAAWERAAHVTSVKKILPV